MKRTRLERVRLGLIFAGMVTVFALVAARLIHIQIMLAPRYAQIVERQSSGRIEIPAERGIIYDRYGRQVAKNVVRQTLYAYPESKRELDEVAAYLDRFYEYKPGTARKRFDLRVHRFKYIERMISDGAARRLEREVPRGLYLREEAHREYPFGTVGKQILGFTNIDGKGLAGFEYSHDSLLSGRPGYAFYHRDGLRNTYRVREQALVQPAPGASVVLTVDWRLQEIVEQELEKATEKYNAKLARAVFLDCNSGDIIAVAHFDPNESQRGRPTKLRAVTDQFEPGSVLKPFGAAAMIDADIVKFDDSTFCENGKWKVGRRTLHDDKELGWLTFRSIIELSSNIGIGKFGCELGGEKLVQAYERFGLGSKTDCGLPGETAGSLGRPNNWSEYNIASLAMGHSLAANAVQIANGFAAIANGGELLHPHILLGEVGSDGSVVNQRRREVIRRVADESTLDSIRAFLRGVVVEGTATPANSPVIAIGGKTGTAEVVRTDGRGYIKNRFIASFAGFYPAEEPVVAGIVVLDQPRPISYGGYTSGVVFRSIAERHVVANPDLFNDPNRMLVAQRQKLENATETPDLLGRPLNEAKELASSEGLQVRTGSEIGTVSWQFPPPDRVIFSDDILLLVTENEEGKRAMCDLTDLSLRQASAFLTRIGVEFTVTGQGRIVKQSIRPGSTIADGAVCELVCRAG